VTEGHEPRDIDLDGLLCALVLVPETFARNRFFELYESDAARGVRRRASRVRGIAHQLLGLDPPRAELVGEQVLEDGQVLLRYRIEDLALERACALSALEAATLRFALHRGGQGQLSGSDRDLVLRSLRRLGKDLELPADILEPE
jgi:hypothetical protein